MLKKPEGRATTYRLVPADRPGRPPKIVHGFRKAGRNRIVALYCRTSTNEQELGMEDQEIRLRAWAKERKLQRVVVFRDPGISGTKAFRPALDRLMANVRKDRVRMIVVTSLDRFGRSVIHLLGVLDELHKVGVEFVSLREAVDTTTPTGKVIIRVMATMAEFERDLISERTKFGMARAKARGVKFGRNAEYRDVELVIKLRNEGLDIRAIAMRTAYARSTVHRILQKHDRRIYVENLPEYRRPRRRTSPGT